MIGVIVAGHGKLAFEITATAESIMGEQEYLESVSVKFGEAEDALKEKVDSILEMAGVDDVLILSDIFGSSFSNRCIQFAKAGGHVAVVTGVNLPMVLKVLTYRNSMNLTDLVSLACKGGKEGIVDACRLLDET